MANSLLIVLAAIAVISCGFCGILAIVAPNAFAKLAGFCGTWINIGPTLPYVETRFDIDRHVLRRTRLFGTLVLASTIFLACLLSRLWL